ncbi:MAG: hypothetical protein HZA93_28850 [Verrucomicrobia bacterium]|nr:hypothetical protein [Verrucomicrobiota bacterium]
MIRRLPPLLKTGPAARRLGLFALCGALAAGVGFFAITPRQAESLITQGGYFFLFAVFAGFVIYAGRVVQARRAVWQAWLRAPGWPLVVITAASAVALWSDPFKHKILFDEYVLQGTALHMHTTKEVGTVIRAYDIAGSWTPIDTFLDKRPYFFTFLVSLAHDLTGYRIANMFLVNAALTPVFFGLVYWLGREATGRRGPAYLAMALLATMPLLGQQASGAGMELHNLVMIALVAVLAVLFLRAPDGDRLSLLVLGTVLLSQSRYESVLFVASTGVVIAVGWWRLGRVVLTWPAVIAPLLLVPYVWQKRVTDATPLLWQLQEGQTSRFSLSYLPHNLEGAWRFFFSTSGAVANSWYLSGLGVAGLAWVLWTAWRWARTRDRREWSPFVVAALAFGGAVVANLALLMFYYWSSLDDVIASRFALPMCLALALLAAVLVQAGEARGWRALRWASVGLAAWLLVWGIPAMAKRLYTSQNLVMQEVEWEHDELVKRRGPILFISNKSTIPFVLWRVPTVINGVGRQRAAHIKYHVREGTFREVVVAQALRPTSPNGDMGVDPEDLMPPGFRLETIGEKRFGARWARLSRLVAIDGETLVAAPLTSSGLRALAAAP